jgi:hypothetical protein
MELPDTTPAQPATKLEEQATAKVRTVNMGVGE